MSKMSTQSAQMSQNRDDTDVSRKYSQIQARISKSPRYQYMLIAYIITYSFVITYNAMIGSFVFMNPIFECAGSQHTEEEACKHIQICTILNDFSAIKRNGLYCDKQQLRSTIQSVFAFGSVLGMILSPFTLDLIGRRKTMILAFSIGFAAYLVLFIGVEQNIQILMIIGMIVSGFFGSSIMIISFLITCDFCLQGLRQKALMIYYSIWGFAQMTFYLLYFYMPQWYKYLIYLLLVPTFTLLIIFTILGLQSPVYSIFVKKDIKMTKKIFQKLQIYNNISQQDCFMILNRSQEIIKQLNKNNTKQVTFRQAFRKIKHNKKSIRNIVCLTSILLAINFFYYGMQGSMERTGFNFGISMFLIGVSQFFAYLSAAFFTQYMKRKTSIIVAMIFSATFGLLFLVQFGELENTIQTILAVLARISSVYIYSLFLILQSQLILLQTRPTEIALINGAAQSVRILLPYIINAVNNLHLHVVIVSAVVLCVLGLTPVFFLDQTFQGDQNRRIKNCSQGLQQQEPTLKAKLTKDLITQYQ